MLVSLVIKLVECVKNIGDKKSMKSDWSKSNIVFKVSVFGKTKKCRSNGIGRRWKKKTKNKK